jgi:hypothetical protein
VCCREFSQSWRASCLRAKCSKPIESEASREGPHLEANYELPVHFRCHSR